MSAVGIAQWLARRVKGDREYALDPSLSSSDLAGMLRKAGAAAIRGAWHRPFLASARGLCFIGHRVALRNRARISVGRGFVAEDGCEIQGLSREGVIFGDSVTVGSFAMVRPSGYYGRGIGVGLRVGDRSNIGPYSYIGASGGISIGSNVMMGPRVSLFAENHNFSLTDTPMREQGVTFGAIVVEDDCWLASGAVILAGVTVGRGSVVAAGAIVTSDVPPYSIVAGSPARVIRSRLTVTAASEATP